MDTLFDTEGMTQAVNPNPCVALFGPGPPGAKCKSCTWLLHRGRPGKRWYKCPFRRSSTNANKLGAASTDQRLSWDACGRYALELGVAK